MPLFRLDITVSDNDFPLAEALVSVNSPEGWEEDSPVEGRQLLRLTSRDREHLESVLGSIRESIPAAEAHWEELPDKDWQMEWRSYFTDVEAGGFLIVPPWSEQKAGEARKRIVIEPKSAFGTGHHPTTTMCLEAISALVQGGILKKGMRFADVGTGTGILGIGCALCGMEGVGVDIDPLSIQNAEENCRLNSVRMELRQGSAACLQEMRFDLVIANILAAPLVQMAPQLMALAKTGGCLVLSGFLEKQVPSILSAYHAMGRPEHIVRPSPASDPTRQGNAEDNWVCLYWKGKP